MAERDAGDCAVATSPALRAVADDRRRRTPNHRVRVQHHPRTTCRPRVVDAGARHHRHLRQQPPEPNWEPKRLRLQLLSTAAGAPVPHAAPWSRARSLLYPSPPWEAWIASPSRVCSQADAFHVMEHVDTLSRRTARSIKNSRCRAHPQHVPRRRSVEARGHQPVPEVTQRTDARSSRSQAPHVTSLPTAPEGCRNTGVVHTSTTGNRRSIP